MMKRYTLLALFLLVCLAGHAAAEGTIYSYAPIAGGASSFAITDDGTLWGWGVNDFGTTTGLFGEDPSGNYYSPNKIMERAVLVHIVVTCGVFLGGGNGVLDEQQPVMELRAEVPVVGGVLIDPPVVQGIFVLGPEVQGLLVGGDGKAVRLHGIGLGRDGQGGNGQDDGS